MRESHAFALLAPALALLAFGATGVAGLVGGVAPVALVGRAAAAFLIVHVLARACVRVLEAVPSAAPPPAARHTDPGQGVEEQ